MSEGSLILGVLGGMGPAATLEFLAKVQAYTPTERERDHIRVIADINPRALDGAAPGMAAGGPLAEMAGALRGAGAEVLAMPCNTAHAHADLIQRASGLPLIDMIDLGAEAASQIGAMRAGVLGTRGALKLYREYLAARAMGLVSLTPESQERFMAVLEQVKDGDFSEEMTQAMQGFAEELARNGAEVLIMGCTEAPLVLEAEDVDLDLIDPGDLLARRAVAVCLGLEALPHVPA